MDRDRYARIRELFSEALDVAPEDRSVFLARACAGDDGLRSEVESLLAQVQEADGFLEQGVPGQWVREGAEEVLRAESEGSSSLPEAGRIGRYKILGLLGEGGMGSVYEAEQENPRRRVALKVLRGWFPSKEAHRRFQREGDILGRLDHHGIAKIYEAGVLEESHEAAQPQPYLAMELVEGKPITRWVEEECLEPRQTLELVAEICDAIHHAHAQGVVHRDLKPANLLVTEAGDPKILDFGIARVVDSKTLELTQRTMTGQVLGTLSYMSPEQLAGRPELVTERSDVYSLGVLLFRLLTGRLPMDFTGVPLPEAARRVQDDVPTDLSSLDRRFRGDIETIVGKALEKSPARRYASAAEMAADIRRHLADEPIRARPPSSIYQMSRLARRHKAIAVGLVVAAVALSIGTALSLRMAYVARQNERAAQIEAYRGNLAAASAALDRGDATLAGNYLNAAPPHLRGWEWNHLRSRLDLSTAVLSGEEGETLSRRLLERRPYRIVWEGTGTDRSRSIRLVDAISGATVRDAEGFQWRTAGDFSPSGRTWTFLGENRRVFVVEDVETGRIRRKFDNLQDGITALRLVDDECVLSGSFNGMLTKWDISSGRVLAEFRAHAQGEVTEIAIDPETSRVFTAGADGTIRIIDPDLQRELSLLYGHEGPVTSLQLDPENDRFLTFSDDDTWRLWPSSGVGVAGIVLQGHAKYVYPVRFHPDRKRLVSGGWDRTIRIWDLESFGELHRIEHPEDASDRPFIESMDLNRTGERAVVGLRSGTLQLFDLGSDALMAKLSAGQLLSPLVQFHPSEPLLLHCSHESRVHFRDASTLASISHIEGVSRPCQWSPDGNRLAAFKGDESSIAIFGSGGERIGSVPTEQDMNSWVQWDEKGERIAIRGEGNTVEVWHVPGARRLSVLPTGSGIAHGAAWHPREDRLALACDDGIVRIFGTDSWAELLKLRGHDSYAYAVEFSADGRTLASSSGDRTVRLWRSD